jgi:hypothetical protein
VGGSGCKLLVGGIDERDRSVGIVRCTKISLLCSKGRLFEPQEGLLTMLVAVAGQVHCTGRRHTGRAGIHHGLERRIVGCTADRRTGCRRTDCHHTVAVAAAGCRRTEVGEDLADSHHILAAGLGSRTGPGSGCCIRKGPT